MLSKFLAGASGATAIEYALLVAGLGVGILLAAAVVGDTASGLFNSFAEMFGTTEVSE